MNTHVLISIESLEGTIKNAEITMEALTDIYSVQYVKGQIAQLQHYLKYGKQISLDEKGIDEKLKLLYPEVCHNDTIQTVYLWSGRNEGYKQALKDLLL